MGFLLSPVGLIHTIGVCKVICWFDNFVSMLSALEIISALKPRSLTGESKAFINNILLI